VTARCARRVGGLDSCSRDSRSRHDLLGLRHRVGGRAAGILRHCQSEWWAAASADVASSTRYRLQPRARPSVGQRSVPPGYGVVESERGDVLDQRSRRARIRYSRICAEIAAATSAISRSRSCASSPKVRFRPGWTVSHFERPLRRVRAPCSLPPNPVSTEFQTGLYPTRRPFSRERYGRQASPRGVRRTRPPADQCRRSKCGAVSRAHKAVSATDASTGGTVVRPRGTYVHRHHVRREGPIERIAASNVVDRV
jgi:hypothetical protein